MLDPDRDNRNRRLIPGDPEAIVLARADFDVALADDRRRARSTDALTALAAAQLGALAGDPATLGLVAHVDIARGERISFSGSLFVVVEDAQLDPTRGTVAAQRMNVVAVELSGSAQWVGTAVGFATDVAMGATGQACCGPETICVSVDSPWDPGGGFGPGGEPGGPPPGAFLPVSDHVGASMTPPVRLAERHASGRGRVVVTAYAGAIDGQLLPSFGECVTVRAPGCGVVQPICDPDAGVFGAGDDPGANSSSDPCGVGGGGARAGRDVPALCTLGLWETLPAECGGWCESCGAPFEAHSMLPPGCAVSRPFDDEGACHVRTAGEEALANAALQLAAGWIPGQASSQCSPSNTGEVEICTVCDEGGSCHQEVRRPDVDPHAAGGSTNAGAGLDDDAPPDQEGELGRDWTFDDETVIGDTSLGRDWTFDDETVTADGNPPSTTPEDVVDDTQKQPVQPPTSPTPPAPQPPQQPQWDVFHSREPNPAPKPENAPTPAPSQQTPPQRTVATNPPRHDDPVTLGDGTFVIDATDLDFAGPVAPLQFVRHYESRNAGRSTMGSAWDHNWSARIVALTPDTLPSWAAPYCAGGDGERTAVLAYRSGAVELFAKDLRTQLFMPGAGSTDTILRVADGWMRRTADGALERYDGLGHLRSRRDRFGNGFSVDVEPTPLQTMYAYYWPRAVNQTLAHRRFALLAWLLELGPRPAEASSFQLEESDYPLPADPALASELAYARGFLLQLAARGPGVQNRYGFARERPTRVTDDLGRTLDFSYRRAAQVGINSLGEPEFDFAAAPDAELLVRVAGPADSLIAFDYATPLGHPPELDQACLVRVRRNDGPNQLEDVTASAAREIGYEYQWPRRPAAPPTMLPPLVVPWAPFADDLEQRYLAYFKTFVGCRYQSVFDCHGRLQIRPLIEAGLGDPVLLARRERLAYIGAVSEKITTVVRFGRVESETRYDIDPSSESYARALAQRYGSTTASAAPGPIPPDRPSDAWRTTLPKTMFDYVDAGLPRGRSRLSERTEGFLPAPLRRRYPLEARPASPPAIEGPAVGDSARAGWCDYEDMERRRQQLPGWQPTLEYTEGDPALADPTPYTALRRTWLTPEQLTLAQAGDPTHNDLLSAVETVSTAGPAGTAIKLIPQRITGRRRRIAVNANRICRWTRTIDRDGDLHYFGLNYRGELLVHAVLDRGADPANANAWVFHERFVSADGDPAFVRAAQRGVALHSGVASTRYRYDVIDPAGSNGWDERLPAWWTRRRNLIRVEELASSAGAVNDHQAAGLVRALGRYQTFAYEPLFNQLRGVERGAIEHRAAATDVPVETVRWVMDYQELSLDVPAAAAGSIVPLLDELAPWGFDWARAAGGYDLALIRDWQLRLQLFGIDLNDDGRLGTGASAHRRGVGRPVLMVRTGAAGGTQVARMVWNSSGRPARAVDADGRAVSFDYYPLTAGIGRYGSATAPTAADANAGNAGLLARVRIGRSDGGAYPAAYGPPAAPCGGLPGPYQWLLPDTAAGTRAELEALGLHPATIDAVLASTTAQASMLSLSYSIVGAPRRMWTEGVQTIVVRDVDGRLLSAATPSRTLEVTLDVDGNPAAVVERGADGVVCARSELDNDEEGRVIAIRSATGRGGPVPQHRYRYTPDGALAQAIDPMGLVISYGRDAAQRVTSVVAVDSARPDDRREQHTTYDDDGRVLAESYGSRTIGGASARESYFYDGLGRMIRRTDMRGHDWHLAHTGADLVCRTKRDEHPYPSPLFATPTWEQQIDYSEFGALVRRIDGGVVTERWRRTPAGRGWRSEPIGTGPVHVTFDLMGAPVWTSDGEGNQTVRTWDPASRVATEAALMVGANGIRRTVSTVREYDPDGRLSRQTNYAGGSARVTWIERGPDGRARRVVAPDGSATRLESDWLGRITALADELDAAIPPTLARSTYDFDLGGRLVLCTDPDGETTRYSRDPFGAVEILDRTGAAPCSWRYDSLGREVQRSDGTFDVRTIWDRRGDRVREEYRAGSGWRLLARWEYDDMARPVRVERRNPFVGLAPGNAAVVRHLAYDPSGRIASERLEIGSATIPIDIGHRWTVAGNAWRCQSEHVCGAFVWPTVAEFDLLGRLRRLSSPTGGGHAVDLHWLGAATAGREHQVGGALTFAEATTLDDFAQPLGGSSRSPTANAVLRVASATRDGAGRYIAFRDELIHPGPGGPVSAVASATYGYDQRGDLASVDDTATTWTYRREPGVGLVAAIEGPAGQRRWALGAPRAAGHELTDVTIDAVPTPVGHDAAGRLEVVGTTSYVWDPSGRLATVRRGGALLEAYLYDDLGRMVATVGAQGGGRAITSCIGWDGDQAVVGYAAGGKPRWQALWGGHVDELLAVGDVTGGDPLIALTDQSTSVVGLWRASSGRLERSATYTPEGRPTVRDEAGALMGSERGPDQVQPLGSPFSTFGAYRSEVTGLVFLRNRWYSPALGQFLSPDPLGPIDGFGLYEYGAGDPINGADPYGLADSMIKDIKSSLQAWQRGVSAVATAAGGFVTDNGSRGQTSGLAADATRLQASIGGTVVATAIAVLGDVLAIGPALVVTAAEIPELTQKGVTNIHQGAKGIDNGLTPAERIIVGSLQILQAMGDAAQIVLFVEGGVDAVKTPLNPRVGPIAVGEIKPLNNGGLRKAMQQAQDWKLPARANGEFGVVQYEPTGDVWIQRYRFDPADKIWKPTTSDYLGRIEMPDLPPAPRGLAVEQPIRDLVGRRTGQPFKPKAPNAPGPDLVPTGPPAPLSPRPPTTLPGLGGAGTRPPKNLTGR